jgi:hypothetical protein
MSKLPHQTLNTFRTEPVRRVLDAVRLTGQSAHSPVPGEISDLVFSVSILYGWNPRDVQDQVEAYADASDALSFA